jgi:pimeloyl-ACP methyl ester carboxylesterase
MTARTLNLLSVPGATLHYEVTGSGPMLLLIADGDSDSGAFDSIIGQLAAAYTVVAYDPRGNSRSRYTADSAGNPANDPRGNSRSRYDADPTDSPADDPRGNSRSRHDAEPAGNPANDPADDPRGRSRYNADPTGKPADSSAEGPAEYPADDPRGRSRYNADLTGNPADGPANSSADDAASDPVAVSTADALALIDLLSADAPAFVFGTGTGAITGLDLITHHPDRVRMLVAHEPPCIELLPEATDARAFFEDVHDTYLREGVPMAQLLYAGGTGLDEDDLPAPEDLRPEYKELLDRTEANAETFFAHKLLPFTTYHPNLTALLQHSNKIVPAAGRQAAAHLPARPVAILSTHLGWPVVSFPGAHPGYASHPALFATLLTQVLEAELT